jgi:anti-sigma factor RsiW
MCERAIELVNAEIDGALSIATRAELNRMLLADPAIRNLRDEMRRVCQALDAVRRDEIPDGLHASIMSALPVASTPRGKPVVSGRFGRPLLRYAAVFAGGLLVSALAFRFVGSGSPGLDPRELAGTLIPRHDSVMRIDLPAVKGQVVVAGAATGPVVVSRLAATSPVTVIASSEGRQVRLDGFVAPQEAPIELRAALGQSGSAQPIVVISLVDAVSGVVLQTASLHPDVPGRAH